MVWAWDSTRVLLSHGLGTAANAGRCRGCRLRGAAATGRCAPGLRRDAESQCPPPLGRTQGSGQGWQWGTDPAELGTGTTGAQHPREGAGGLPGRSLTKLADVPVSGLAALVIPVEGGRRLHLHTVPKPVSQQEGGEAGQRGGTAVTPSRGSGVPWTQRALTPGCPAARKRSW